MFLALSSGQLLINTLLFFGREKLVLFDRGATRIDKRLDVLPVTKLASVFAREPPFGLIQQSFIEQRPYASSRALAIG